MVPLGMPRRRVEKNGAAIVFPTLDLGRGRAVLMRSRARGLLSAIDKEICHVALHSWNGRAGAPAEVGKRRTWTGYRLTGSLRSPRPYTTGRSLSQWITNVSISGGA